MGTPCATFYILHLETIMPTRAEWHAILERQLPPQSSYIARSRAITALYARWYLQEPWLFKWAGLAAFASAQVGGSLALVELLEAPHGAVRVIAPAEPQLSLLELSLETYGRALNLVQLIPLALHDAATRALLLDDLELFKQANDAIFADIGWAHLAYASAGLKALEPNMATSAQAPLLEAFRMLDEGVQRLQTPAGYQAGAELIQQGSVAMLRHEQWHVLPPYMERISPLGQLFASLGAILSFEGGAAMSDQIAFSGYFGLMPVLSRGRSVANTADRWEWIEQSMLPCWARLDAAYSDDCAMHRQLVALANETPTMLQRTAGIMNLVYPALALKVGPLAGRTPPPASAAA